MQQTKTTLDEKTIEIIKSTVPVLEVHGKQITTRFYQLMFGNHPELLNIFNHANQKLGRQQGALANAVYAAALHIDQLENILPVVKQIGHKHRSLGVKPEHYPIVGKHLLLAIKDVLGEAATDEIIEAWGNAYQVIADAFISVEDEMYKQAENQQGGWADFRPFQVTKKVQESKVITSFYLEPEDGQPISSYKPGQYVSVKVDIPGEKNTHIRQYSLSIHPGNHYYRISVKREDAMADRPEGKVSTYLHQQIDEGDILHLSAPAGDFVLDQDDALPVVLLSGGVGLTPLLSMLHTVAKEQPERDVYFVHAAINGDYHALRDEVVSLAQTNPQIHPFFCYESPTEKDREQHKFDKEGYVDLPWLQSIVPSKEAQFYFCGPIPFMKAMNAALKTWGVPAERIHFEFFGPAAELEEA